MAGNKSQTCSYRVWYIYFAVCTSVSLFSLCSLLTMMHFFAQNWSCLLKNLLYNFSLWYLVFRTNLNQSGPIKIQWSSLLVCIFSTSSNNVEEVAILFSVIQPFTTKAGGGMRAKPTAWCSKNLRQKLCNCGYGVPNHESFISTKILRFFKHLMSNKLYWVRLIGKMRRIRVKPHGVAKLVTEVMYLWLGGSLIINLDQILARTPYSSRISATVTLSN